MRIHSLAPSILGSHKTHQSGEGGADRGCIELGVAIGLNTNMQRTPITCTQKKTDLFAFSKEGLELRNGL